MQPAKAEKGVSLIRPSARGEAGLRRVNRTRTGGKKEKVLAFGDLRIDPNTREVKVRYEPVVLTAREFDLLYWLARSPRRVYTRNQLLEAVWGYTFVTRTDAVTVHVSRLRRKIEPDPTRPRYLQTVRRVSYRFGGG
ncbi:MAG: response regulator transcription factor [Actinobacteria bacterium]|nr:response regulator transcription factor [Actinomycetota bacterium]